MDAVCTIDAPLTEADVDALFEVMLGRPCDSAEWRRELASANLSVRDYIGMLRNCKELRDRATGESAALANKTRRNPEFYRVPTDLAVTSVKLRRVLVIGSCLMEAWSDFIDRADPAAPNDLFLLGGELPAQPPHPIADYDFQLVQIPLRFVLPDGAFTQLKQSDAKGHQDLLNQAASRATVLLESAMRWNRAHGILTFVFPFIVPEQNMIGRLLPRYLLRNPVFFIERLNEALSLQVRGYRNAFLFDFNEVLATHGRLLVQEDGITQFNHGAFRGDYDYQHDINRAEPVHRATEVLATDTSLILSSAWQELVALWRTVMQTDMVKMVVVDLDDTLWRGTIAELDPDDLPTAEGWPRGLWEALQVLKRRGILLSIVSNNDEQRVTDLWHRVLGGMLRLEDFAVRRIDWRTKSEKMREVLEATGLLARNVVFIDDNPLQRAEVQSVFPEMRVLGGDPFLWRSILLWAPETQVVSVTDESGARTEMVQAQQRREDARKAQPRHEFLASLQVKMNLFAMDGPGHSRFPRVLELINKTNQFNTTGERWSEAEITTALQNGLELFAFDLTDIHTEYGLVGVLLIDESGIRQFVMSCRVLGLDAELAAVSRIVALFRARGRTSIAARVVETGRNLPSRNLFERCDFTEHSGMWRRETNPPPPIAAHIALTAPPLA